MGAQAVLNRTGPLGRGSLGVEPACGVAGGPVAMGVDLADAFAWAADIVAPRGRSQQVLVDSGRVLGCQLAGHGTDAGGMEEIVCGHGVVVRARSLVSAGLYAFGQPMAGRRCLLAVPNIRIFCR